MTTVNDLLAVMHKELIDELRRKIKAGEATAADLSVARQMLKDNSVTAEPVQGSPIVNLALELPFSGTDEGPTWN